MNQLSCGILSSGEGKKHIWVCNTLSYSDTLCLWSPKINSCNKITHCTQYTTKHSYIVVTSVCYNCYVEHVCFVVHATNVCCIPGLKYTWAIKMPARSFCSFYQYLGKCQTVPSQVTCTFAILASHHSWSNFHQLVQLKWQNTITQEAISTPVLSFWNSAVTTMFVLQKFLATRVDLVHMRLIFMYSIFRCGGYNDSVVWIYNLNCLVLCMYTFLTLKH
jgi:hypothetical protein